MRANNFLNLLLPFVFLIIFAIIAIANRIAEERRRARRRQERPLARGPLPEERPPVAEGTVPSEMERLLAEIGLPPPRPKPGEEAITITEEHLARPVRVPGRPPKRGVPRGTLETERVPRVEEVPEALPPEPVEGGPERVPEVEGVSPFREFEPEISLEIPEKAPPPATPAPSGRLAEEIRFKKLPGLKVGKPSVEPARIPRRVRRPSRRIVLSASMLQKAIIYREILSPPVGLRLLRRRHQPLPKQRPV